MSEVDNPKSVSCNIRLAAASDAPALAILRYALRSSTRPAIEDERVFLERCSQWMSARLKEQTSWRCWVAEQDQIPIAAIWVNLIEKIPNPNSEPETFAYITNFYVSEHARGKGLGSRLLSNALAWCKDVPVHAVILWPTERSRSLYERYGFAVPSDFLELVMSDASR